jgi:hypothetical protein
MRPDDCGKENEGPIEKRQQKNAPDQAADKKNKPVGPGIG